MCLAMCNVRKLEITEEVAKTKVMTYMTTSGPFNRVPVI